MIRTNHPMDLALRVPGHQIALGQTLSTPAALAAVGGADAAPEVVKPLLARHASGDWGNVGDGDKALNDAALECGQGRVWSVYEVEREGQMLTLWVITEADRSSTTVLLPEDY